MSLSRPTAALVVVAGVLAGGVIVAGFLIPRQLFEGVGLYLFLVAGVVELVCAYVANAYDVRGALR